VEKQGLILITYRDRKTHLSCFLSQLQKYWPQFDVCICEQSDSSTWNKGLLYNVGFKELGYKYDYLILHDVDFIPVWDEVDYSFTEVPCMIAGAASQFGYRLTYPTFFGGVVTCSKEHYELINGFSNQFKGYGGEDDHTRSSFVQKGLQPGVKMGRFECFAHPKPDITPGSPFWKSEDYQHNWKLVHQPRDFNEGLSTVSYKLTEQTIQNNITHLYINTANG